MKRFIEWLKGSSRREFYENLSYLIIILGSIMFVSGVSIGSYVSGFPVLVAIIGSFFALLGLVLYILSQVIRLLG